MTRKSYGVSRIVSNPHCSARRLAVYVVSVLCILLTGGYLGASPLLQRGEELFMQNQPEEAAPVLEAALEIDPSNERIYLYLGIVYEQLGSPDRAAEILRRGVDVAVNHRGVIYFNLANNYVATDNPDLAEQMYTQAIRFDGSLSEAYLNRANLRVRTGEYQRAIDDYSVYLNLAPSTPQRPQIVRMIALLRDTLEQDQVRRADEERRAAEAAERARIVEEQQQEAERQIRLAEQRRQAEEEERRRVLLESVLESLGGSRGETRSLGGGAEDIRDYEDSFDIVD